MKDNNKKISVIVPVYNEMGNIAEFHRQIISVLSAQRQPYEILYVDDNSKDGTYEWLTANANIEQKTENREQNGNVLSSKFQVQSSSRMYAPGHRRNVFTEAKGEIKTLRKAGKQGKAFSLIEGFAKATGGIFVMIDGDLQYPIDKIPEMIAQLKYADVIVAERKKYQDSRLRGIMSRTFRNVFGKFLFGLTTDIQSGLKIFKREVYKTVKFNPVSPWTFDLEFLYRATQAGYTIGKVDIAFLSRTGGKSKVSVIKTPVEIGFNALRTRLKKVNDFPIIPDDNDMRGAGVGYKKKKYVTHTTLSGNDSALQTFTRKQKLFLIGLAAIVLTSFALLPLKTAQIMVAFLSLLYFIDTIFNLFIVLRSLKNAGEVQISDKEIKRIDEAQLPTYTILCPLYKEAHVVPQFLEAISKLDWPKAKLDVMFLLEEDDVDTIEAFGQMTLPYYARTVIVPHSMPKTKPKACNYGLSFARGEYLVIYDAEDIPDVLQLKKAYLAFKKVPENVQCLQAKLNYYNSSYNLLTRFFTAEYSLWFDITLPGLQSLKSTLPLGGTSNHFKTKVLKDLQGWDPFNVTEDADLGIRLFQKGYQTAVIDSTTYEEATSRVSVWLKQRSRWLKGYMQTYLVHMRNFRQFVKEKGLLHNIIFQLTVGGKILFILVNPLLWILTLLYFTQYSLVGPLINKIYVPPISYFAVFSWIFGNFLFLYYYMLGIAKRNQWEIAKYVFLIPAYWFILSIAGMIAFYQLLFKPHYWEKTTHGFHLGKGKGSRVKGKEYAPISQPAVQPAYVGARPAYLSQYASSNFGFAGGKAQLADQPALKTRKIAFSEIRSRKYNEWILRSLPIVALLILDVVMVGFVLTSDQAQLYLLASLVVKAAVVLLQASRSLASGLRGLGTVLAQNFGSFFELFQTEAVRQAQGKAWREHNTRILIFNWRDTKHVYAGGAEVYIDELAKRWVKDGNKVTLFCGNDNHNPSYEVVNGVEIYRRGGTYMVYVFALLYYILKFRGKYDVIIDCENGIPFFTPLFTMKPIVLLVHHVHQEIFRTFLKFPLNHIARFLEGKLMPLVYSNKNIVTVSPSSREEIFNLGFTQFGNIEIIPNGVSPTLYVDYPKTSYPSFVYVGRLKEYKNIDIALKAFARVLKTKKDAQFSIAGWGEAHPQLQQLVKKLGIEHAVTFHGKVSEKEKAKLLGQSWAAVQPSLVEGWGITVLEANAAGTPVIVSKVNGLQDAVIDGQTGLLVEVGNIRQFATAMQVMITDQELRERFAYNARRWSLNFDWDKSAYNFYQLIGRAFGLSKQPSYGEVFAAKVNKLMS